MFSRLTQGLRGPWARALAAMYLCCLLAPGAAFAFGDGVAARCALAGLHQAAMLQAHEGGAGGAHAHHTHGGGAHDHGAVHAASDDSGVLSQFAPASHVPAPDTPPHHSDKDDKMCCGLACLSALPAALATVSPPDFAASAEMTLPMQALAALTPARLYKPPIA